MAKNKSRRLIPPKVALVGTLGLREVRVGCALVLFCFSRATRFVGQLELREELLRNVREVWRRAK